MRDWVYWSVAIKGFFMDWAITIVLMLCVVIGGALSAAQATGVFTKNLPEPLRGQQSMQVGFAWMLASIVPFWRGQPALGGIALFVGAVTFLKGCLGVYGYGKEKAREARLAAMAHETKPSDVVLPEGPYPTGKSASKRRRRAARQAALDAGSLPSRSDTQECAPTKR